MPYLAIPLALACLYLAYQLHRSQQRFTTERDEAYKLVSDLVDRHDRELQQSRADQTVQQTDLLDRWKADRAGWTLERSRMVTDHRSELQVMLDRIQAPEKVVQHAELRVQALEADGEPHHIPQDGSPAADQMFSDLVEEGVIGG